MGEVLITRPYSAAAKDKDTYGSKVLDGFLSILRLFDDWKAFWWVGTSPAFWRKPFHHDRKLVQMARPRCLRMPCLRFLSHLGLSWRLSSEMQLILSRPLDVSDDKRKRNLARVPVSSFAILQDWGSVYHQIICSKCPICQTSSWKQSGIYSAWIYFGCTQ